jgi:hypothetical protein
MKIEIAPDILSATTKCPRDFVCLAQSGQCTCQGLHCVRQELLFVKKAGPNDCPYLIPFGQGHICRCPTRMAIYDKYQR